MLKDDKVPCAACGGKGKLPSKKRMKKPNGQYQIWINEITCTVCKGLGKIKT